MKEEEMRLTERTDTAFRILMYLGLHRGTRCAIDDIVERCKAHRSQVVAAVQVLRKAGYIESSAGRSGGIWLAREPEEIDLGSVVTLMETDLCLAQCFQVSRSGQCSLYAECLLRPSLQKALDAFFEELRNISLRDILHNGDRLRALLGSPRGAF